MSAENKVAEKMDVLFGKVYLPTFMEKLAARGVKPASEEELQDLLKIAVMTRMNQEKAPAKESKPSVIKEAAARLEAVTFGDQAPVNQFLKDPEVVAALA